MIAKASTPSALTTNIGCALSGGMVTHTTLKLRTTIEREKLMSKLKPIHPGEVLREEFMIPLNLNPHKLAMALRVPPPNMYDIIHEEAGISSEMALRLGRYFGTTPEFWNNLQAHYSLAVARQKAESSIKHDVRPREAVHA
jgi:antitoxin HigA-1